MNIPGYTIKHQIGHGGMATVYYAIQESLGRPVALKVMNPLFAERQEFSKRFLNEGRLLASLQHNNVITIYDIGICDNVHYFSMEYVNGGDLRQRIQQGIDPRTALSYVIILGDCLRAAHNLHIVHRDLKPANILFRHDGTLLLTDFGVAKRLETLQELTATGGIIGSPSYMSPEQAKGETVDGRADIYSLGIILYEMLVRTKPFSGDSAVEIALKHITHTVPPLPQELAHFQALLAKMTAKNPQDRFQSTSDLLEAARHLWSTEFGNDSRALYTPASMTPLILGNDVGASTTVVGDNRPALESTVIASSGFTEATWRTARRLIDTYQDLPKRGKILLATAVGVLTLTGVVVIVALAGSPTSSVSRVSPDQLLATSTTLPTGAPAGLPQEAVEAPVSAQPGPATTTAVAAVVTFPATNNITPLSQAELPTAVPIVPATTLQDTNKIAPPLQTQPVATVAVTPPVVPQGATSPRPWNETPPIVVGGPQDSGQVVLATPTESVARPAPAENVEKGVAPFQVAALAPSPQPAHQAFVDAMLRSAELALAEYRLTTPENYNAEFFYQRILEVDPNNQEALLGFSHIADRYAILAEEALRKGQRSKAENYVDLGLGFQNNHPTLLELQEKLQESKRVAQAPRQRQGTTRYYRYYGDGFFGRVRELFR